MEDGDLECDCLRCRGGGEDDEETPLCLFIVVALIELPEDEGGDDIVIEISELIRTGIWGQETGPIPGWFLM